VIVMVTVMVMVCVLPPRTPPPLMRISASDIPPVCV
jgi:hypothetical protein